MEIFKKSFEIFRRKILILFLIKFIFVILSFSFLIYSRNKLQGYLLMIQQYAPQIVGLESLMQDPGSASLLELESILNVINPIIQRAMIFTYLIVPLAIFLLWCFFGSLIWKLIHEGEVKTRHVFKNFGKFFLKFLVISLPCYLLLILLLYKAFQLFLPSYTNINLSFGSWQLLVFLILLFIIFYFTFIFYTLLKGKEKIFNVFKKSFIMGIRRSYILIPLFLPLFFILLLSLALFSYLYIVFISKVLVISSLVYALISLAILLVLLIWYKIILKLVLEKY